MQEIQLELTARQRELLLKYGHPFEAMRDQLLTLMCNPEAAQVLTNAFYLAHLTTDLLRSVRNMADESVIAELDELLVTLDIAELRARGRVLDVR